VTLPISRAAFPRCCLILTYTTNDDKPWTCSPRTTITEISYTMHLFFIIFPCHYPFLFISLSLSFISLFVFLLLHLLILHPFFILLFTTFPPNSSPCPSSSNLFSLHYYFNLRVYSSSFVLLSSFSFFVLRSSYSFPFLHVFPRCTPLSPISSSTQFTPLFNYLHSYKSSFLKLPSSIFHSTDCTWDPVNITYNY